MYDIVMGKNLNKGKVVIVVIILVLLIALATMSGMKLAHINAKKNSDEAMENFIQQAQLEETARQQREEEARLAEIQSRIDKTSTPLTQEEQDNILHIYRSTGEKRVFLTFDDGPSQSVTPLILDVLKQENVKATFFVLGTNAKRYPDLIKREFDEGHYIANHGYTHKYSSVYSSPEATLEEYNTTEQIIRDALENPNYISGVFRFPGGSNGGYYNTLKQQAKALLRENGIVHLDWNCLSKDAEGANSKETLLQNIIDTAGEKDSVVVLMHDASDKILTYETLIDVINYFRDNGYKFENIYDLLN